MRLHSIDIPVADLDRAVDFYTKILGFPLVTRSPTAAILFIGDVHGGMVTLTPAPSEEVGHGGSIVLFAEQGVPAARAELEARGLAFSGPTETAGLGPTARFLDSEGNRLAIRQPSLTARFRASGEQPLGEIRRALVAAAGRASELLVGMTEEQGRYTPAPGEWSVIDQVGHVIDSLDSGVAISLALAAGRRADESRLWRESYPAASLAAVAGDLRRAFSDMNNVLEEFPPEPNLEARLLHGVFGPLNCLDWLAFTAFHVDLHLGQIERITEERGYPAS